MFMHQHFFSNREWVARGSVVLMLGLLFVSQHVFQIKPLPPVKAEDKPIRISLAAPEPTPEPTPVPPQPVEPPPPPPPEPTPVEPPPPPPVESPVPMDPPPPPPPPKPVEKPKPVKKPVKHERPVKKTEPKKPVPEKQPVPEAKSEPVKDPAPEKAPVQAPVAPAPSKPAAPASNPSHEAAYVSQVRLQIEHHKIYPALARKLDMSGTVEVAYTLDRQGRLVGVEIAKSSGSDILDKAALQAVRSALFPPIPEDAWRGDAQKQFRTSLVYSLSDDN